MSRRPPIGLRLRLTAKAGNETRRSGDGGLTRRSRQAAAGFDYPVRSVRCAPFRGNFARDGELRNARLFRIPVKPTEQNGLTKPSQVMVDKPQSVARKMVGSVFGRLDDQTMLAVNRALAVFLGFA